MLAEQPENLPAASPGVEVSFSAGRLSSSSLPEPAKATVDLAHLKSR